MSAPPSSFPNDTMYVAATAHCQAVWNAINAANADGTTIEVCQFNGNLNVTATKGEQQVYIDAASPMNFSSVITSTQAGSTQLPTP